MNFTSHRLIKKLTLNPSYAIALASGSVLCWALAYACYLGANRRDSACFEKVSALLHAHLLVPTWLFIFTAIAATTFYIFKIHSKPNVQIELLPLVLKSTLGWLCAIIYAEEWPNGFTAWLFYIPISLFFSSLFYIYFKHLNIRRESKKKDSSLVFLFSLTLIACLSAHYIFDSRMCYKSDRLCWTFDVQCAGFACGRVPYFKTF